MKLVEKHIIKPGHKDYQELDHLLFLSKNLYNKALYEVRQYYFQAKDDPSIRYKYLNYYALDKLLKERDDVDYRALLINTSQEVLKIVNQNFCSFFKLLSMKRERISSYPNKVQIPKYLDKVKGRQVLTYNFSFLQSKLFKETGIIQFPRTNIKFKPLYPESLKQVRIVPKNGIIVIEEIYEKKEKNPSGKRIKRGLYSSPKGLLNADINGSLNILRKFLASNNKDFNSPVGKSNVDWPVRIKNPQRIKL